MNADFRKGWRAACEKVAKELRTEAALYRAVGSDSGDRIAEVAERIAADTENSKPPKTMTVVDAEGRRLL